MEFRDKKYLDYAGLNDFWGLVKDYYKGTVDKANSALQNIVAEGVVSISDGVATFDFSNFAKKSEIASVFSFKGAKASMEELPSDAKVGDVYLVGDKEYVFVEGRWEELGYPIDLSNYYTKEEIDSKLQNLQDIEDLKNEVEVVKFAVFIQREQNLQMPLQQKPKKERMQITLKLKKEKKLMPLK